MDTNVQKAYDILEAMGVPVINREDEGLFIISGEDNPDTIWADYYNEFNYPGLDDFGVNTKINKVLAVNSMYAEWVNPAMLAVHYV